MAEALSNVLTEVGTNELEIVEFLVDGRSYAINVAKVREIIRPVRVMKVPETHPCMVGVFRNREDVIPLVDLGRWLGAENEPDPHRAKVIVAEFNGMKVGFNVHQVVRIQRTHWGRLERPDHGSLVDSPAAVGLIRLSDGPDGAERIVFLLDFERIVAEIGPEEVMAGAEQDEAAVARRRDKVVLVAEDSALVRKMIRAELERGGYRVLLREDGLEAWETLEAGERVDAVVSDIEMPRMDGHHLTRRIKEDDRFRSLPVVLYSSMIYDEMRIKGESVGADAQICKPELPKLVETLDRFVFQ